MEENNNENLELQKKNNIYLVMIIILIIMVLGLVCYIERDKLGKMFNTNNTSESNESIVHNNVSKKDNNSTLYDIN